MEIYKYHRVFICFVDLTGCWLKTTVMVDFASINIISVNIWFVGKIKWANPAATKLRLFKSSNKILILERTVNTNITTSNLVPGVQLQNPDPIGIRGIHSTLPYTRTTLLDKSLGDIWPMALREWMYTFFLEAMPSCPNELYVFYCHLIHQRSW